MSHRPAQVASTLHRAIQQVIDRGLSDPRIKGMVSVTDVKVSPDLSHAVVSVTISPEDKERVTLHGLHSAAGHIRRRAGDLVDMRRTPQLTFKIDRRIKRERRSLEAISLAVSELERDREPEAENDPADDNESDEQADQTKEGASE